MRAGAQGSQPTKIPAANLPNETSSSKLTASIDPSTIHLYFKLVSDVWADNARPFAVVGPAAFTSPRSEVCISHAGTCRAYRLLVSHGGDGNSSHRRADQSTSGHFNSRSFVTIIRPCGADQKSYRAL